MSVTSSAAGKPVTEYVDLNSIMAIRLAVLRPDESDPNWCIYPGDRTPGSRHLRARFSQSSAGVCSLLPDPREVVDGVVAKWRLRGLAVIPPFRGKGVASQLVEELLGTQGLKDLFPVWGSGRSHLVDFYIAMGAVVCGSEYSIPGTGNHLDFLFTEQV